MSNQCVGYYRVSTDKQGLRGLGMQAQKSAVQGFVASHGHRLIGSFEEVESGKRTDRPMLQAAIDLCRKRHATLVIAKLDRLARNTSFVLNLRDSGVDFVACDMPFANKLTVTILAAVAEQERDWISERTRAGLAQAKARGVKLGNPMRPRASRKAVATLKRKAAAFADKLQPTIAEIQNAGVTTLKGIAKALNARGFNTPLGKPFTRQTVARTLRRLAQPQ